MYKFVNYKMKEKEVIDYIKNWIQEYSKNSGTSGLLESLEELILLNFTLSMAEENFMCSNAIHQNKDQRNRGENISIG